MLVPVADSKTECYLMPPLLRAIHQARKKIIYLPIGNFRPVKFTVPVAQNFKIVRVAEHFGQLLKGIGDIVKKGDAKNNIGRTRFQKGAYGNDVFRPAALTSHNRITSLYFERLTFSEHIFDKSYDIMDSKKAAFVHIFPPMKYMPVNNFP